MAEKLTAPRYFRTITTLTTGNLAAALVPG